MNKQEKIDIRQIAEKEEGVYTLFMDGSAEVMCEECGKWDEVGIDSPRANFLHNNKHAVQNWQCGKCWKKGQSKQSTLDGGTFAKMDDVQDRIAWNSALNNSVNLLASSSIGTDEVVKAFIEKWQLYFYDNIINRNKK